MMSQSIDEREKHHKLRSNAGQSKFQKNPMHLKLGFKFFESLMLNISEALRIEKSRFKFQNIKGLKTKGQSSTRFKHPAKGSKPKVSKFKIESTK